MKTKHFIGFRTIRAVFRGAGKWRLTTLGVIGLLSALGTGTVFLRSANSASALGPIDGTLDAGTTHYPDLQTLPPSDVTIETDATTGQKLLRFSNTIANEGKGRLEVVPVNNTNGTTDAYQQIYSHDLLGQWYVVQTRYVGTFAFHPEHNHWHFEDFARYELRDVAWDGSIGETVLASSQKVSFCITDSTLVDPYLDHASATPQYVYCDQSNPQGISVGWADTYKWDLAGQSLDITGLPDGNYWIVSTADPDNLLDEGGGEAESNNTAAVSVHITGSTVTVGQ